MGTPKCSRYQAASALGSRALKNTPPIPTTCSMQTPFLRASELVILSRKRIDYDGPKSAGQSANFQMTRWVRRISAARTAGALVAELDGDPVAAVEPILQGPVP